MYTSTENYVNYYVIWQYQVTISIFYFYNTITFTLLNILKFYIKYPLEFYSIFYLKCPGFRNSPYQIPQNRRITQSVFVPAQKTLINSKKSHKPK